MTQERIGLSSLLANSRTNMAQLMGAEVTYHERAKPDQHSEPKRGRIVRMSYAENMSLVGGDAIKHVSSMHVEIMPVRGRRTDIVPVNQILTVEALHA